MWQSAEVPPTPSELRERSFFRSAKRDPGEDPRSLLLGRKGPGIPSGIPFCPSKKRPFSKLRRSWGNLRSMPHVVVSYSYHFRKSLELSCTAIERCREKIPFLCTISDFNEYRRSQFIEIPLKCKNSLKNRASVSDLSGCLT